MDVVTLGETMILFTPTDSLKYSQYFTRSIGGAETNVAIGLARLGHKVGWMSQVGDDQFGESIKSFVLGEGVDIKHLKVAEGENTGIYFKEIINTNNYNIQYYRENSAASKMKTEDLDEDYIASSKYLFVTGITPALSESCYLTVLKAVDIAKSRKVEVVFDPNHRRKLWSDDKARARLLEIALKSNIFLPGKDEAKFLLGIDDPKEILSRFKEKGIPLTILKDGSNGSCYLEKDSLVHVPAKRIERVIDPVGAGDAFAAGLLSGFLDGLSLAESVERGNILGASVVQRKGDIEGLPSRRELMNFNLQGEDINR